MTITLPCAKFVKPQTLTRRLTALTIPILNDKLLNIVIFASAKLSTNLVKNLRTLLCPTINKDSQVAEGTLFVAQAVLKLMAILLPHPP